MKKYKEYKSPKAEVVEFECVDVITVSATPRELHDKIGSESTHTYVYTGGKTWDEIYK